MSQTDEKAKTFDELLRSTQRDGIDNLIRWLHTTDFYTAPASTKYHLCHPGGLLEHSLNVYNALRSKHSNPTWKKAFEESSLGYSGIIIVSLLHDVCKADVYKPTVKNKKVYNPAGSEEDAGGRYNWQQVVSYTYNDKNVYGHGEKSVDLVRDYIWLTYEERKCIRYHMGPQQPGDDRDFWTAAREYPTVLATHQADSEATILLEKEE